MNREVGELQHIEQRRMLTSPDTLGRRVMAEFVIASGAAELTAEVVYKPSLVLAAAIGAVATAGVEFLRHHFRRSESQT